MAKDQLDKLRKSVRGMSPASISPSEALFAPTKKAKDQLPLKQKVFTERVTLPLSEDQSRFINELGKTFHKSRRIKLETINRNSIIRALINVLQEVKFSSGEVVNNEEELTELFRKKLR